MKKFNAAYIYVVVLFVVASACKKDEQVPKGEFASGVIIVNEGNFSDADGTIGFYSPTSKTATQDIYQKVNNEAVTGIFQSIFTFENKSYLIDQLGNKIVVVEAETFKYIATIDTELNTPRYMTIANGKGYVSNWGDFAGFDLPNSYIAVIDLSSYSVIKTINTANGVEGMLTINNEVYAAASYSNKIHVINPENDEIVGGFETPASPRLFAEDGNGRLWVLCNDYVKSNLAKIDVVNKTVLTKFEIASGAKAIGVNGNGSKIYYLSAPWQAPTGIFVIENSATFAPQDTLIVGENFYGFGINPTDETIYAAINNPTGNGTVVRYNADGTKIDNFASGRFPNGFEFRK